MQYVRICLFKSKKGGSIRTPALAGPLVCFFDTMSHQQGACEHQKTPQIDWAFYLLECRNGCYYAGITNNVPARLTTHQQGRGAKYTKANPPERMVGIRFYPDRASASRAEWQIKQLSRAQKLAFINTGSAS